VESFGLFGAVSGSALADPMANLLLWAMLLLYGAARLLQLFSGVVPTLAIVALHVVPPAVFALVHASGRYRLKGGLIFVSLSAGTGFIFESLSLRTGFPFGHYHFTAVMGPTLFQVPILLALAYVGMGYLAWTLALLIANQMEQQPSGFRLVTVPLLASFIMIAWDLSMEPEWATVDRAWVWETGGRYFGVPISNFLGWFLTAYIFYQVFAVYVRDRDPAPQRLSLWRLPILFYALSACGNLLVAIPTATAIRMGLIVTDPSGQPWRVSDIVRACVIVSLFVMVPLALVAWVRLNGASHSRASNRIQPGSSGRLRERQSASGPRTLRW
jgi:uncharacterized membrane protein